MKKRLKVLFLLLIMIPITNVKANDITCDNFSHLTGIYTSLRIIAPFLLVLFGSLDFFKSMVAGDEKKQIEARSKFFKRLIALLLLIILPFIVQFLAVNFGKYNANSTGLFCCVVSNGSSRCNFRIEEKPSDGDENDPFQKPEGEGNSNVEEDSIEESNITEGLDNDD